MVDGEYQGDTMRKVHNIGRIYTVGPRAGECYYLRLLLNEVSGKIYNVQYIEHNNDKDRDYTGHTTQTLYKDLENYNANMKISLHSCNTVVRL